MKRIPIALCAVLLSGAALLTAPAAHAQINVNVNPPSWGPAVPAGAQYYYIPETDGFYDVPARQYVVLRDGRWVRVANLTGYNPASFHPVVVDYIGAQPWVRYDEYRGKYGKKRNPSNGGLPPGQAKKLYEKGYRDNDRYENRDDDRHENRDRDERRDNDNDNDNDRGNGNGNGNGKGTKDKD